VPYYVSATTWKYFFQQDFGTINQVLRLFGIEGPAWLRQPFMAFIATVIPNIWMSYPFFMVTILGALQSIPWWKKLTSITLPLIRPAVMPAIVLSSITTFQMFGTASTMVMRLAWREEGTQTAAGPCLGTRADGTQTF